MVGSKDDRPREVPFGKTGYFLAGACAFLVYVVLVSAVMILAPGDFEPFGVLMLAVGLIGLVASISMAAWSVFCRDEEQVLRIIRGIENPPGARPIYRILGVVVLLAFLLMVILLSLANR